MDPSQQSRGRGNAITSSARIPGQPMQSAQGPVNPSPIYSNIREPLGRPPQYDPSLPPNANVIQMNGQQNPSFRGARPQQLQMNNVQPRGTTPNNLFPHNFQSQPHPNQQPRQQPQLYPRQGDQQQHQHQANQPHMNHPRGGPMGPDSMPSQPKQPLRRTRPARLSVFGEMPHIKVWTGTWNMGAKDPLPASINELSLFIPPHYDMYVLGVQEGKSNAVIDLVAGFLLPYQVVKVPVQAQVHGRGDGSFMATKFTGINVFVKKSLLHFVNVLSTNDVSLGFTEGSKGGACMCINVLGSTMVFISMHLPANQPLKRVDALETLMKEACRRLFDIETLELHGLVHHIVLLGDMNFRLHNMDDIQCLRAITDQGIINFERRQLYHDIKYGLYNGSLEKYHSISESSQYGLSYLLAHDELSRARSQGLLSQFLEPAMQPTFYPSYKRIEGRGIIDWSEFNSVQAAYKTKHKEPWYKGNVSGAKVSLRVPAFTDRVLYWSLDTNDQCCIHCDPTLITDTETTTTTTTITTTPEPEIHINIDPTQTNRNVSKCLRCGSAIKQPTAHNGWLRAEQWKHSMMDSVIRARRISAQTKIDSGNDDQVFTTQTQDQSVSTQTQTRALLPIQPSQCRAFNAECDNYGVVNDGLSISDHSPVYSTFTLDLPHLHTQWWSGTQSQDADANKSDVNKSEIKRAEPESDSTTTTTTIIPPGADTDAVDTTTATPPTTTPTTPTTPTTTTATTAYPPEQTARLLQQLLRQGLLTLCVRIHSTKVVKSINSYAISTVDSHTAPNGVTPTVGDIPQSLSVDSDSIPPHNNNGFSVDNSTNINTNTNTPDASPPAEPFSVVNPITDDFQLISNLATSSIELPLNQVSVLFPGVGETLNLLPSVSYTDNRVNPQSGSQSGSQSQSSGLNTSTNRLDDFLQDSPTSTSTSTTMTTTSTSNSNNVDVLSQCVRWNGKYEAGVNDRDGGHDTLATPAPSVTVELPNVRDLCVQSLLHNSLIKTFNYASIIPSLVPPLTQLPPHDIHKYLFKLTVRNPYYLPFVSLVLKVRAGAVSGQVVFKLALTDFLYSNRPRQLIGVVVRHGRVVTANGRPVLLKISLETFFVIQPLG